MPQAELCFFFVAFVNVPSHSIELEETIPTVVITSIFILLTMVKFRVVGSIFKLPLAF